MDIKPDKRTHRRRTLEQIEKEMAGFDHDLIMAVYHRINGRIDEAETYSQAYFDAQDEYQKGAMLSPLTPLAHGEKDGYETKEP